MADVKGTMMDALKRFSEKDKIPYSDVRLRIEKKNGSLNYHVMNKAQNVRPIDMKEILGGGTLGMMAGIVNQQLHIKVSRVLKSSGLTEDVANIRVYPKKDTPAAHLFDGGKAVKAINIDELIT